MLEKKLLNQTNGFYSIVLEILEETLNCVKFKRARHLFIAFKYKDSIIHFL